MEELSSSGDSSSDAPQFEYIMTYRAKQGYTVIQSKQLAVYDGVADYEMHRFRKYKR